MALKQSTGRRVAFTAAAWLVAFLIFFPILWMFLTSFKSEADAYAIPPKFLFFHWTTENYAEVQSRADYFLHAWNSIVLSVGANIAGLILAIPAAWSMAFAPTVEKDPGLTKRLYAIMAGTIVLALAYLWFRDFTMPESWYGYLPFFLIVGVPIIFWIMTRRTADVLMWMLSTKMMPGAGVFMAIYFLFLQAHLLDNRWGVGFLLMMANLPIIVWMLYTYFKEIPVDILEAARMDGASLANEIIYVLTPMAVPGIASTMLLSIILSWNEAFWTLNLTNVNAAPLTNMIASFSSPEGDFWALLSAASVLAIAPILVLGWFSQKQLVRGLTFGAVK
jgi:sorbitol/mannitol transport system permease protein